MLLGAKMLESRADAATSEEYRLALDKIRSVMESEDQHYLNTIDDSIAVYKPQTSGKTLEQETWLPECRAALSRSQVMIVDYEAGSSAVATTRELEAIGLYYYNDDWHLIAWCRLRDDYRDFRLDRVKALTLKPEQFMRREHASLQEYLERERGSAKELHEIVVNFSFESAKFVGEQRYRFGIVRERETEEGVEMTFVTPYLDYIARWLLQFAGGASNDNELLQPVMAKLVAELGAQWTRR